MIDVDLEEEDFLVPDDLGARLEVADLIYRDKGGLHISAIDAAHSYLLARLLARNWKEIKQFLNILISSIEVSDSPGDGKLRALVCAMICVILFKDRKNYMEEYKAWHAKIMAAKISLEDRDWAYLKRLSYE